MYGKLEDGDRIRKDPCLPFDVTVGYRRFAYQYSYLDLDYDDEYTVDGGNGFELGVNVNIGKYFKVPQFFFNVSYAIGVTGVMWNSEESSVREGVLLTTDLCFSFIKKFYVRNIAFVLQPGYSLRNLYAYLGATPVKSNANGFYMGAGVELAISLSVSVGVKYGYEFLGNDNDIWEGESSSWLENDEIGAVDNNASTFGVYFTFSPSRSSVIPFSSVK